MSDVRQPTPGTPATPPGGRPSVPTQRASREATRQSRGGGADQRGNAKRGGDRARTPAEIEAELAATREHLADTLDLIATRVHPKEIAGRSMASVRGYFVDPHGAVRTDRLAKIGIGVVATVGMVLVLRRMFHR